MHQFQKGTFGFFPGDQQGYNACEKIAGQFEMF